jgi:hypothetical protein
MSHDKENGRLPITTVLLQKYYQQVLDLETYLPSIVEVPALCTEGDEEDYTAFLRNTVVATNSTSTQSTRFIVQDVNYGMEEVVQHAQKTVSKRAGDRSKNVLAIGCNVGTCL